MTKMEEIKCPEGACPDCGGEGWTIGYADTGATFDPCARCRGTGEATATMKYKIQVPISQGWADQKVSEGGPYVDDHFGTIQQALDHIADIREGIPDYEARVVPADTPQDGDLYE